MTITARAGDELHDSGKAWQPDNIAKFRGTKVYRDATVCWVMPTRGSVQIEVLHAILSLQWPMNQNHTPLLTLKGMEVGEAYEQLFEMCLDKEVTTRTSGMKFAEYLDKMGFVLTSEEDNLPPPNGINELFRAIYTCVDCGGEIQQAGWVCAAGHRGLDAVSGLYWTKDIPAMPMAYGDPKEPGLDFAPVDVTAAIEAGSVVEVNGIAMGFTLYRKEMFAKVSRPWFATEQGVTQDLYFCKKAKEQAGARFAVHCGVRVGHINADGELY